MNSHLALRSSGASSSTPAEVTTPIPGFFLGQENALVRVACERFRNGQSESCPLFFHGPSGVGKTHLTQGLVAEFEDQETADAWQVVTTTGTDFARDYADAVELDTIAEFRQQHRTADLLLIEDLHQLKGKQEAQRELTQTLETLLAGDAWVVATANQRLTELVLESGLVSRLSAGLSVRMHHPESTVRRAITRQTAARLNLALAPESERALANRVKTVPQLTAALMQLTTLDHAVIDEQAVDRLALHADWQPTIAMIAINVAKAHRVTVQELRGPTRKQGVVKARSVAVYLARELTAQSLQQIGRYFGNRDHTTILHAWRKIQAEVRNDMEIRLLVIELRSSIQQAVEKRSIAVQKSS